MVLDLLQKDRARLESLMKSAVEKVAQDYIMGVAIAIKRQERLEDSRIQLKITTPE